MCRTRTSGIPVDGHSKAPRPLTREEIQEYVRLHAQVAKKAVVEAGFDGIELDLAGGYLIDEFLKEFTNKRTDEFGGSPENRSRFALEIIDAVANEIGADRIGVKLTPWDTTRGKGYGTSRLQFVLSWSDRSSRERESHSNLHISRQGDASSSPRCRILARF